jgi:hypothetical protein
MAGVTADLVVEVRSVSPIRDDAAIRDETFDRDLLLHLVRHAEREAQIAGQPIEKQLGVTHAQL